MNRYLLTLLLIIAVFLFTQLAIKRSTLSSENKDYIVVERFEKFEIRNYPEIYVAKTILSTSGYDGNSSAGFRRVAGYIFGANDKQLKIAMTSPVLMDMKDSVEMSFIMPQDIDSSNAPNPNNSSVKLEFRPEQKVAVLKFSGWASSKKLAQKEKELLSLLKQNNIDYTGDITYLGYNPPYQVIDRKNEISIKVNYTK